MQHHVGRFAPSPTGPLHLGSLTTAVASYLDARAAGGEWLVRVEDIDPPREVAGAADEILRTLEALGLEWDRGVLYQSTRLAAYRAAADALHAAGAAFECSCSRADVRLAAGGGSRYPGTCRDRPARTGPTALRVRVEPGETAFDDRVQGRTARDVAAVDGDYVIYRRDALPAYHLAVVVDDALQGITDIVRGVDLIDSTPIHVDLQRRLGLPTPLYAHLPVVVNAAGQKLSKQTGAAPIGPAAAPGLAAPILGLLGLAVPAELAGAPPRTLWVWAAERWTLAPLAGRRTTAPAQAPP